LLEIIESVIYFKPSSVQKKKEGKRNAPVDDDDEKQGGLSTKKSKIK